METDIFIEELNLAIEFNGTYWHSENGGQKDKHYHINKYDFFKEKGIELIQIWEHHWKPKGKRKIVESILKNRIGIIEDKLYGRKCKIKLVETKEEKEFLNKNHIQGYFSSTICIGLYYNNELVQLTSFRKPRFSKKYDWEILRSCSKLNTTIVGGSKKIFKHFLKNYEGSVISYVDKTYFNGKSYASLGFEQLKDSPPSYWYTSSYSTVHHRSNFQKHKLSKILEDFDPQKTEVENMFDSGYDRIWDVGNYVFIYKR